MKLPVGLVGLLLLVGASDAVAQPAGPGGQQPMPAQQPYYPPPPGAQPMPAQQPYYPPPPGAQPMPAQPYYPPQQPGYYYPPPAGYAPLTPAEQMLLAEGEISNGQILGGAMMSFWMGMGIGQAIEGRWSDTGWIFTLGEPVTLVMVIAGAAGSCNQSECDGSGNGLLFAGLIGYLGLRTWGFIDIFTGPQDHNRRVRELRGRVGPGYYGRITPFVLPAQVGDGATAGLTLSF